jgi:ComF family protein
MVYGTWRERARTPRQPNFLTEVYNWPRIIQKLVFPPTCLLCGDPGAADRDLCQACAEALPYLETACPVCGLPLAAPAASPTCGACQQQSPPFDRMVTVFRYEEPARHLIQSLKFGARHANARLLGALLADRVAVTASPPEAIIPVPLHPARYRERGFNQSLEIARVMSRQTGIPLDYAACRRIRHTDAQARLNAEQRRRNIRRAFHVDPSLPYRHVAILDDVVTTAATVGELAKTLRRAGVTTVEVWACARAVP